MIERKYKEVEHRTPVAGFTYRYYEYEIISWKEGKKLVFCTSKEHSVISALIENENTLEQMSLKIRKDVSTGHLNIESLL